MNEGCPCIDAGWLLRFERVLAGANPLDFPCDQLGNVDLNAFDDEQRNAYFSARILRGLHHPPRVIRAGEH